MAMPFTAPLHADDKVARYLRIRQRSLALSSSLGPEDQQLQAFDYASPTKWHLAHTTWFFEAFVLYEWSANFEPFDRRFSLLFNSYYEGAGPRIPRSQRGALSQPTLTTIHAYREAIDDAIVALLQRDAHESLWSRVELGLNHEEQHQELILTDILANFSVNPLLPAWRNEVPHANSVESSPEWINFSGQLTEIGTDDEGFSFDNEKPRHRVFMAPFALRSTLVTNGEMLDFMRNGGYQQPKLWLADGIAWVRQHSLTSPAYWRAHDDGTWHALTLYGERPIEPHAPLTHISGYEADALATWLQARLPSENEWEFAASIHGGDCQHARWLGDGPVLPIAHQPSATRPLADLYGEVWEWTRSAYGPYPGYRPFAGQVGEYNGKFMANQWVLRGGSCATPPGHVRLTYRNFFYPHDRWQFSGLRLAQDR